MASEPEELSRRFHAAMLQIYESARRLRPPYVPGDFLRLVTDRGGKAAADYLLSSDQPSSGFTELYLRGKENLRLSVEFLVLQDPWRRLFTPEQRAKARRRLIDVGVEPPPEPEAESPIVLADEIAGDGALVEGAVTRIVVNTYERNPIARARCISHYGARCTVCGIDFGETYGAIAQGYIHVHHIRPISSVGAEYEVDPINDLRPVCPNCHSIIHLGGITRSIDDVRALLRSQGDPPNE